MRLIGRPQARTQRSHSSRSRVIVSCASTRRAYATSPATMTRCPSGRAAYSSRRSTCRRADSRGTWTTRSFATTAGSASFSNPTFYSTVSTNYICTVSHCTCFLIGIFHAHRFARLQSERPVQWVASDPRNSSTNILIMLPFHNAKVNILIGGVSLVPVYSKSMYLSAYRYWADVSCHELRDRRTIERCGRTLRWKCSA